MLRELLRVGSGFGLLRIGCRELAAEALDASGGVDQLLLAGEERVAGGADFDDDVALVRGTRLEDVSAGALHIDVFVGGMNSSLCHGDTFRS
jgi:hypothetical protein